MDNLNFVHTEEQKCMGCNKCMFVCPTKANKAVWENDENKVIIKDGFCISCGDCISICDHDARNFIDDTEEFFFDLEEGKNISLIIAPAAHYNFEDIGKIISFLKDKGVKKVYDVSYGADICTWAYVKAITEHDLKTVIAQPCPVVVSYIEKFKPELIKYLSPIQSPAICVATYLKNYQNITDDIAFLSPCIGKKRECLDSNTNNKLTYNITFAKLIKYIECNNIDLDNYPLTSFDSVEHSYGFAFPRPGGLTENVKLYLGNNVWTKQIEGIKNIEDYFKSLAIDLKNNNPTPLIIDALNCEHGCNLGTGTLKDANYNHIDFNINNRKRKISADNIKGLINYFDSTLNLEDFYRSYNNKSDNFKKEEDIDLESIYIQLGKTTEEKRNINCFSCGYGNCESFVRAVAIGDNHVNNCRFYLLEKFISLSSIDVLTGTFNRYSYFKEITNLTRNHPNLLGIIFVDINKLKEINDTLGHDKGDLLIIGAANILKQFFGNNVYRVGGDEFVVMKKVPSETYFNCEVSNFKSYLDTDKSVLMSYGYSFSTNSKELSEKINEAESSMYKDKSVFYSKNSAHDRRKNRR